MEILKNSSLAFMLLISIMIQAQNPTPNKAKIWYFGENAGLDFNQGLPVPITNGAVISSEGVASISDANGQLQFYTNGDGHVNNNGAVWNRNHQVMPNGFLANTSGCASSVQSSLIIEAPGNSNAYYLFTTDCVENNLARGLRYAYVDMNLDGGLGDVVVKDVELKAYTNESLTAVRHANGKEYWVITHIAQTDSFYAYHLGRTGIIGVVKSKVGPVAPDYAGEINPSFSGDRLVFSATDFTGLFSFDKSTGELYNHRDLQTRSFTSTFSPNCNFLYTVNPSTKEIFQFDLNKNDLLNSKTLIGTTSDYAGSIKVGPDNKIYIAQRNSSYLSTIERPDYPGMACNFQNQGIHLDGKRSKYGLPNFPNDFVGECSPFPADSEDKNQFWANIGNMRLAANTASFQWGNISAQATYNVQYRSANDFKWKNETVNTNEINIDQLEANSDYEVRIISAAYGNAVYYPITGHEIEDVKANGTATPYELPGTAFTTLDRFSVGIYPNPVRGQGVVEIDLGEQSLDVMVQISDMSGRTVYAESLSKATGTNKVEVPFNGLANGMYQLSIQSENQTDNKKFIVMN
ncbi:MAG: T9SS type A sorting domain-containing protein [Chitinophagales bacterium]